MNTLLFVKVVETGSDDSFSDEDSPKKRNILTRRPSYRKILNDLGGGEITGKTRRFCLSNKLVSKRARHSIVR